VLYAGNLGLSQALEHVLVVAQSLARRDEICFVFVGDGAAREQLVSQTAQMELPNVRFIPFQPRERLPEVLATADVSLVTLQRGIGTGSLPSKTFSILASGRPVLVSVDAGSETWRLVERAKAGLCVPPECPSALAEAILTLKGDKKLRERLGRSGRKWAEDQHSPQAAAEQFEELLLKAVTLKEGPSRAR
jgi:colanic acid biosynthesis glycosyl transferase WcaI